MFKLYFQSGEFYGESGNFWISVFKDFLIPLLGVGVPLGLFYLGIKKEREKTDQQRMEDELKSRHQDNMRLLYFHSLLKQALVNCEHFRSVLEKILVDIKDNIYHNGNLEFDGDSDLKRIVIDLDRESLFYAYRQYIDDLSLNIIFKGLSAAYESVQTFKEMWVKTNREVTNKKNEFRSTASALGLKVIRVNNADADETDLKILLMEVIKEYADNEAPDNWEYKDMLSRVVDPFVSILEEQGKATDPLWRDTLEGALRAQILDKQIESIVQQYGVNLGQLVKIMKRVISNIEEHCKPLENYLIDNKLLTSKILGDKEEIQSPEE